MSDKPDQDDEVADKHEAALKHETARTLTEHGLEAQAEGDEEEAERLFTEAEHTDQGAMINILQEQAEDANDPVATITSDLP